MHYVDQMRDRAQKAMAQTIVTGFTRVVKTDGNFRGSYADLTGAIHRTGVSIEFLFTPQLVRGVVEREADRLRAAGVEVTFHDDRDEIELQQRRG